MLNRMPYLNHSVTKRFSLRCRTQIVFRDRYFLESFYIQACCKLKIKNMHKIFYLLFLLFSLNLQAQDARHILFFGDSITAGYGIDIQEAFPALIQDRIDSLGLNYEVINGGLSGETSAGGLRRIDWVLQRPVDIMVLELGGNDGLRGIDLRSTRENLQQIINKARAKNPDMEIILVGMQVPPNLGIEYTRQFSDLYPELAKENDLPLVPLSIDEVSKDPEMMQADGIHPTEKGHRLVAELVWEKLYPIIR